jgi:hypothetical protein
VVTLYAAVVRATSLKRNVRVVIVDCMEPDKKIKTRKVFFSTDTEMSAKDIMGWIWARSPWFCSQKQALSPI